MISPEENHSLYNAELGESLNQQEKDVLLAHNKIVNFSDGDVILHQGKTSSGIYVIIHGSVQVTAKILGKDVTTLGTLGPGNFFGEISFIEKGPCATSIIANNQVQCLLINSAYIELLTIYFPETKYKILKIICRQICERLKIMHDKITHYISASDMATRSLFSEIIHSLQTPLEISAKEGIVDASVLQQLPSLSFFTPEEKQQLFENSRLVKAPKNCTLIHKGEQNASCYIVIHGAVQSSVMHNNKAAKLSVIGPPTLFASVACIDAKSMFTITFATCEEAVLYEISAKEIEFFKKNNPSLWYKLFDLICKSLVALEKSVDKLDIRLNIETYNR